MKYYLSDELYHYGQLGQKWGIRRYQNPDGSLTAEGKLRYRKGPDGEYVKLTFSERRAAIKKQKTLEKARKAAEAAKKNKSPRGKKINELTDKQLDKYIDRMNKEKTAIGLRNDINKLDPKSVSRGEQFIKKVVDDVLIPEAINFGKKYLEKMINEATKEQKDEEMSKYDLAKRNSDYYNNLANIENKKADYNKTKYLNDEYSKKKDVNVYFTNRNNNNNNNGGQNDLSKKKKKKINSLAAEGKNAGDIARSLDVSESAVTGYLKQLGRLV